MNSSQETHLSEPASLSENQAQNFSEPKITPQVPQVPEPQPPLGPAFAAQNSSALDWSQDTTTVRVRLPIKGTSLAKIDVFLSNAVLKVNLQERKIAKVFDLFDEIDFTSKENKVLYVNEILEVTMVKLVPNSLWTSLVVQNLPKEQVLKRRQESFLKKEQHDQEFQKKLKDLKVHYDSHATRELMRKEEETRKELESLKNKEKSNAQDQIFGRQEETIKKPQEHTIIYTHKYDWDDYLDQSEPSLQQQLELNVELPKVRNNQKIDIQFTEKIYPMVATREQHFQDAPLPRQKGKQGQKQEGTELEQKNPIWVKGKADEFFKNKDFYSAINGYTQAHKLDSNMISNLFNRAACHLHLFNFEETLADCSKIQEFFNQKLLKNENYQLSSEEQSIKVISLIRKAISLSWKGLLEEAREVASKILETEIDYLKTTPSIKSQATKVHSIIEARIASNQAKLQGDNLFEKGLLLFPLIQFKYFLFFLLFNYGQS